MKAANPDFGQKRILAAIKSAHPKWAVSEKRLQKAIADLPPAAAGTGGYRAAPSAAAPQAVDPVALDDAGPPHAPSSPPRPPPRALFRPRPLEEAPPQPMPPRARRAGVR